MKSKRLVLLFGILAAVLAFVLRRIAKERATGLDARQTQDLLAAIQSAYASTLAAFDPTGDEPSSFEARDARAAADTETLRRAAEAAQPALSARLGTVVAAFVENVTAAQVQIMAFAINRKNRGLPDSAQAEAEGEDRKAFKRNAEPLFTQLVAALS